MSDPFTFQVPSDVRYRVIAPEVASRYLELLGGSEADRQHFAASVAEAMAELAGSGGDSYALRFAPTPLGVEVTIKCGGKLSVVRHPLPTTRPGTAQ